MIKNERDIFIGAHVTGEVKQGIRTEAMKERMSMSALIHRIFTKYLKEKGHSLKETVTR